MNDVMYRGIALKFIPPMEESEDCLIAIDHRVVDMCNGMMTDWQWVQTGVCSDGLPLYSLQRVGDE